MSFLNRHKMLFCPSDILLKTAAGWKPPGYPCCFRKGLAGCSCLLSAATFLSIFVSLSVVLASVIPRVNQRDASTNTDMATTVFQMSRANWHILMPSTYLTTLPLDFISFGVYSWLGLLSRISESLKVFNSHALDKNTLFHLRRELCYFRVTKIIEDRKNTWVCKSHACNMWHCGALWYRLGNFKELVLPEGWKGIYY